MGAGETCWWAGIEIQIRFANPFVKDSMSLRWTLTEEKKFTHTFLTHLRLQCPLMAAYAYTHQMV